jgi:hypothetical protein
LTKQKRTRLGRGSMTTDFAPAAEKFAAAFDGVRHNGVRAVGDGAMRRATHEFALRNAPARDHHVQVAGHA